MAECRLSHFGGILTKDAVGTNPENGGAAGDG